MSKRPQRPTYASIMWLLEELKVEGLSFDLIAVRWDPKHLQSPEFLALNPLAQIPVMVYKKGTTIYESGAAVQFLLEELGDGRLEPSKGSKDRAAYLQWFHFGEGMMASIHDVINHTGDLPEEQRIPAVAEAGLKLTRKYVGVIEAQLKAGGPFLCGDNFTAADIMVGYSCALVKEYTELLKGGEYPSVVAYMEELGSRPAFSLVAESEANKF